MQFKLHIYALFYVLLAVHLSILILVINQLDAKNLFYNNFISCLYIIPIGMMIQEAV